MTRLGRRLDYCYSDNELEIAARELLGINAPRCAAPLNVHDVTHLYRAHIVVHDESDDSYTDSQEGGIIAIENDQYLGGWLRGNGYNHPEGPALRKIPNPSELSQSLL